MNRLLEKIDCGDSLWRPLLATTLNIAVLYVVAFAARLEFFIVNREFFPSIDSIGEFFRVAVAGLRFDTPGILYVNLLYIFMVLFPLRIKERAGYYSICKWVYIISNAVALFTNLADSIYYQYTLKRSTADLFIEFSNENNTLSVVGIESWHHWWVVGFGILLVIMMWKLYTSPLNPGLSSPVGEKSAEGEKPSGRGTSMSVRAQYYWVMAGSLVIAAAICVGGIRGGLLNHWIYYFIAFPLIYIVCRIWHRHHPVAIICLCVAIILIAAAPIGGWRHRDIRPMALSNANAFAKHPTEVALILNTPFSVFRTLSSNPFNGPTYFEDASEMKALFSPEHPGYNIATDSVGSKASDSSGEMIRKNVVVIILESFGEEYIGFLNDRALGPDSPGYAPFMDSLARNSLRFKFTYDNGNKSIDAMPSILASIPKFSKSFILTSSALQPIAGLPELLNGQGYATSFFHGARTGSMGFDGFARLVGFREYFGREDFDSDSRFGGDKEFDGYWAIWDEPFMQYFAAKLSEMTQPFMSAIFTASSHHPFNIPAKYEGKFAKGTLPIHKCIGYTDMALREFFASAAKTDWYKNTIFVITNDHTNQRAFEEYRSDIGIYYGPLLIFDPGGEVVKPGVVDDIISQIDIMPTLLGLLRYPESYVAYGTDMSGVAESVGLASSSTLKRANSINYAPGKRRGRAISFLNNIYQYVEGDYILQFDGKQKKAVYRIDDHLMRSNLIGKDNRADSAANEMERRLKAMIQTYNERRGR